MSKPIDYDALNEFFDKTHDQADEVAMFLDQREQLAQAQDDETRQRIEVDLKEKAKRIKRLIPGLESKLEQVRSLSTVDGGTINAIAENLRKAKEALFGQAA